MIRVDLPAVRRVHTATGSHIEPALDQEWNEAAKLAWQAAVTAHETGLTIDLYDQACEFDGKPVSGHYAITVGHSSCSSFTYRNAWTFLNGVSVGAKNVRDQPGESPCPT